MRITFAAWVTALSGFVLYLQAAGQSRHTIKLRTYWVRRLARDTGSQDPWTLSAERIIEWLAEPSWSPETRKAARASVCSFYRWAIEAGELPPDDSPTGRLPAVTVPRSAPRPAPSPVLNRALLLGTDRDRLLLMLAAYAGLRRAEIARVHPDDVDRERMVLVVRGKGGRVREIPVHPDLLAAIDAEIDRRRAGGHGTGWRYTAGIAPDAYLFPGTKGPHMTAGHVGKVLCRLLGGRWTAHTLRHRFATRAHEQTHDLRAVQELLGHSKLETTQRYVAVSSDAMRAAVLAAASVA